MAEQQCKYEGDIAVMKSDLPEIKEDIKEILHILKGDNGEGLVTKVALNADRLNNTKWWFRSITVGFIGICGWVIKQMFGGGP